MTAVFFSVIIALLVHWISQLFSDNFSIIFPGTAPIHVFKPALYLFIVVFGNFFKAFPILSSIDRFYLTINSVHTTRRVNFVQLFFICTCNFVKCKHIFQGVGNMQNNIFLNFIANKFNAK